MEAKFRTRMDRSLDEIAAEMHSGKSANPFGQAYTEKAFVGAEHTYQKSSISRRYTPYPDINSGSFSQDRDEELFSRGHTRRTISDELDRPFSFRSGQAMASNLDGDNRVFVGNLSYSTTWQALKEHMRRAGPVRKCDVFTEAGGKSKGMGLVQYESADSAERALLELQESVLNGRRLFLRKHMDPAEREKAGYRSKSGSVTKPPSNPAATVFVQNLEYSVTWQKLKDVLKVAGKIVSVDVAKGRDGKSKGYASVQFSEPFEAINAIALFHGQMLSDRPMKLRMDSGSPYQPDPIQLRLSGLAGVTSETQAQPLPPPPSRLGLPTSLHPSLASSFGESSSLNVPFLTAVISSLTAEKLAAILIQNSSLGASSIVGAPSMVHQQQLFAPPMPHPPFPFHAPPSSVLGTTLMDRHLSGMYKTRKNSQNNQGKVSSQDGDTGFTQSRRVVEGEPEDTKDAQSCKVFVNNINFSTSWRYLRNVFKTAGPIRYVDIFKNSSGKSKGCGIVVYCDQESALKAIRMFNNKHVDGRKLTVDHDRSQHSTDKFS